MPARIAFEFVLDELAPLSPRTRPMFGCQAIYEREAIRACELILKRDPRIGKVPKPKKQRAVTKPARAKKIDRVSGRAQRGARKVR